MLRVNTQRKVIQKTGRRTASRNVSLASDPEFVAGVLEATRNHLKLGDRMSILAAMLVCKSLKASTPSWLADAVISYLQSLQPRGERRKSLDDLKAKKRWATAELARLGGYKTASSRDDRPSCYEVAAEELAETWAKGPGGGLSAEEVKACYGRHRRSCGYGRWSLRIRDVPLKVAKEYPHLRDVPRDVPAEIAELHSYCKFLDKHHEQYELEDKLAEQHKMIPLPVHRAIEPNNPNS